MKVAALLLFLLDGCFFFVTEVQENLTQSALFQSFVGAFTSSFVVLFLLFPPWS